MARPIVMLNVQDGKLFKILGSKEFESFLETLQGICEKCECKKCVCKKIAESKKKSEDSCEMFTWEEYIDGLVTQTEK